jgi:hypothetical protein
MPALQVLILIVDQPYDPDKLDPTLDANAIEAQSTINKPTVEIQNAYGIGYFHRSERREKFGGKWGWRWTDSVCREFQPDDGSYEAQDGVVFGLASYDAKRPTVQIIHWTVVGDVNVDAENRITKEDLRKSIDAVIRRFEEDFIDFNCDSEHTFGLELLGTKDFDETTNSRFAMVRKYERPGPRGSAKIPVWTRRYWWEIKEIQMDDAAGIPHPDTCYPTLLSNEIEKGKDGYTPGSRDIPM